MNRYQLKRCLEGIFYPARCFESRLQENGLERDASYNPQKYTFCYKAPGMRGYWWMQVNDYQTFEDKYLDLVDQGVLPLHFYEELQEDTPSKLYFDIEADSWTDMHCRQLHEIVQAFADALAIVFSRLFTTAYDETNLRFSTACNATKFSLHAMYTGFYTRDNIIQKHVAEELVRVILSDDSFISLRKKSGGTVIDTAVYTKRRIFRHLFSWKDKQPDRALQPYCDDCPIFSEYVVQQIYATDSELFFKPEFLLLQQSSLTTPRIRSVTHPTSAHSPIASPVLAEIERALHSTYPHAVMYTTARSGLHENIVTVGYFQNGTCPHGKTHNNNHCYLRYNRQTRHCVAYFFSSKCARAGVTIQEPLSLAEWVFELLPTVKVNTRYLTTDTHTPIAELRDHFNNFDLVCVRSATDTGKTSFLEWAVNKVKARNSDAVITSIGCRQSFASNSAPRLGISNYQDLSISELNTNSNCVVQLDSLLKNDVPAETRVRDLLILDETTALLAHLLGDTLKQKQRAIYKKLRALVVRAKKVVCVCADLDEKSIAFLKAVVNGSKSCGLLLNEWKDESKTVYLYEDKAQFEAKMFEELENGRKLAYCNSYSALDVKRITDLVKEKEITADRLTGRFDTKSKKDHLCTHLDELQQLQFFGYTSTLTVGVDINFDHFDTLFCDVSNKPLVARDVAQMMARVRKLTSNTIHLCVTQRKKGDLSKLPEKDAVKQVLRERVELPKSERHATLLRQYMQVVDSVDNEWNEETGQLMHDETFLELITSFAMESIASRMDMKSEMRRVCEDKGFIIEEVPVCVFQTDADNLRESQILAREFYHSQVADSQIDWAADAEEREAVNEEDIYSAEKRLITTRIQCSEEQVTAEVVADWGIDGFSESKASNAALLTRLAIQSDMQAAEDVVFDEVKTKLLDHLNKRDDYDGPTAVLEPKFVQARKLELLFKLLVLFFGFTNGILDRSQVEASQVVQKLQRLSAAQKKKLRLDLMVEFGLSCEPQLGNYFVRSFSDCLYKFCGVRVKNKTVRIASRRVQVYFIERESVNKLLQYWHVHSSAVPWLEIEELMRERNVVSLF